MVRISSASVKGGLTIMRPEPDRASRLRTSEKSISTRSVLGMFRRSTSLRNASTARRSLMGYQNMKVPVAKRS